MASNAAERKYDPNRPHILGQFNYHSFKPDLYNVQFTPFQGAFSAIMARNLTYKQAITMVDAFNDEIFALKDEMRGPDGDDEPAPSEPSDSRSATKT